MDQLFLNRTQRDAEINAQIVEREQARRDNAQIDWNFLAETRSDPTKIQDREPSN